MIQKSEPASLDQEIDCALQMLAERQPPAAMAARIHQSLEAAAAMEVAGRRQVLWLPAACAVVGALLLVVLVQTHVTRRDQTFRAETAKMATNSVPSMTLPYSSAPVPAESSRVRKGLTPNASGNSHGRRHPQYRHAANLFNYPLTRQEKLLVRFVQTAKPADLQTLNPEYQAKLEAQQDAEFAAYLQSGSSGTDNETSLQE